MKKLLILGLSIALIGCGHDKAQTSLDLQGITAAIGRAESGLKRVEAGNVAASKINASQPTSEAQKALSKVLVDQAKDIKTVKTAHSEAGGEVEGVRGQGAEIEKALEKANQEIARLKIVEKEMNRWFGVGAIWYGLKKLAFWIATLVASLVLAIGALAAVAAIFPITAPFILPIIRIPISIAMSLVGLILKKTKGTK